MSYWFMWVYSLAPLMIIYLICRSGKKHYDESFILNTDDLKRIAKENSYTIDNVRFFQSNNLGKYKDEESFVKDLIEYTDELNEYFKNKPKKKVYTGTKPVKIEYMLNKNS